MPVGARIEGGDRRREADEAGHDEDQSHPTVGSGSEPPTDGIGTSSVAHEGDDPGLGDWPDQKGSDRRRGSLGRLGEAEYSALLLVGHDPLDDRLLGRLGHGYQCHVKEEADHQRHDRRTDREEDRDRPEHDIDKQQGPHGIGPETPARYPRRRPG